MTKDGVPMLSDFGQARAMKYTFSVLKTSNYYRQKGTLNWIAPEIARYINAIEEENSSEENVSEENVSEVTEEANEIICTDMSDMWSYGIVIYVNCCFITAFTSI